MTTRSGRIEVGGVHIEVVRKDIKNVHLGVYPPAGRVRVAVPLRLTEDAIRLAIVTRLGWIRRQRSEFSRQERQSQREFVTGESHYFQGSRYRLDVVEHEGPPSVALSHRATMRMSVRPGTHWPRREKILNEWYRERLRDQLPPLLAKWERKSGLVVNEVRIRRMRTRWGACTSSARRIWLNLELAKKPPSCLEFVLVHELVHLEERHHSDHFFEKMDKLLPTWRRIRAELNRAPLAHEEWEY